jgi:hypothetical protein
MGATPLLPCIITLIPFELGAHEWKTDLDVIALPTLDKGDLIIKDAWQGFAGTLSRTYWELTAIHSSLPITSIKADQVEDNDDCS